MLQEQLEQAQSRLEDVTRKSRFTAGQSSVALSQRPSFNAFLAPAGLSVSRAREGEFASQLSGDPTKATRTRELPAALAGNLADFVNDQKRDMD